MEPVAANLHDALLAALPGYLARRLVELGEDPGSHAAAIEEALAKAAADLEELLRLPFSGQPLAPLQVVRRALPPLAASLSSAGVPLPDRDQEQTRVAPDDEYGLAPASAADLGEDALRASLAWGVAKSAALRRPLLLVVTANLMDGSRFEAAATAAGYRIETSRDGLSSSTPAVAFVDLECPTADEAIRGLAAKGVRVVAYGPHVDDLAMTRARALGAMAAEPRSRVLRDPAAFLPPLV